MFDVYFLPERSAVQGRGKTEEKQILRQTEAERKKKRKKEEEDDDEHEDKNPNTKKRHKAIAAVGGEKVQDIVSCGSALCDRRADQQTAMWISAAAAIHATKTSNGEKAATMSNDESEKRTKTRNLARIAKQRVLAGQRTRRVQTARARSVCGDFLLVLTAWFFADAAIIRGRWGAGRRPQAAQSH